MVTKQMSKINKNNDFLIKNNLSKQQYKIINKKYK